jgi:ureidoglycolate lyase
MGPARVSDRLIRAAPLTAEAFRPFGAVVEALGEASFQINRGMCDRFHDLARAEIADAAGTVGISIGRGRPYALPLRLELVERHPLGSQLFMPLEGRPFLVVVAPDEAGVPGRPLAFVTRPGQGVNYRRNIWHGVLTPLGEPQDFLIVDRVGPGTNLEEHFYEKAWTITV